jgi:hypothetical protein
MGSVNRIQILIGMAGMFIGSLVYFIDRPYEMTYFISYFFEYNLFDILPPVFGIIGHNLPSFIHVFSFTLITAGILKCGRVGCLIVCSGWILINSAFEFGQKFNDWAASLVPDWFAGILFLENTRDYFLRGTFDYLDLAAAAMGAITAYVTLWGTTYRDVLENEKEE